MLASCCRVLVVCGKGAERIVSPVSRASTAKGGSSAFRCPASSKWRARSTSNASAWVGSSSRSPLPPVSSAPPLAVRRRGAAAAFSSDGTAPRRPCRRAVKRLSPFSRIASRLHNSTATKASISFSRSTTRRTATELDTPGRQAGPRLAAEQRAEPVADQAVDDAPRLLGVDQVAVDLAGVLEGGFDGALGDLVDDDPIGVESFNASAMCQAIASPSRSGSAAR